MHSGICVQLLRPPECARAEGGCQAADSSSIRRGVYAGTRWGIDRASSDVMSGILNCVCPECGGSMGGVGREFNCQGECQTDWRQLWEQIVSAGSISEPRRQPAELI